MENIVASIYNLQVAIRYIAGQMIAWIVDFLRRWYVDGFYFFARIFMRTLMYFDRTLALRVNIKNIFKPMYQDRSVIGYALGFILRSIRTVIAVLLYATLGAFFIIIYAIWALIPGCLVTQTIHVNAYSIF